MRINCLYRDFFIFLNAIHMEKNKWKAFREYYYLKHKDFLDNFWFNYQGYTIQNIRDRVNDIKASDYSHLEEAVKLYDLEEATRESILRSRNIFPLKGMCNVYIFIGFFSPDMCVVRFKDDYVICVGLERFKKFTDYPVMMAHEYCHLVLNKLYGDENNPLRRIIKEGIAICFSREVYPGLPDYRYLFMHRSDYNMLSSKIGQYFYDAISYAKRGGDIFHGNVEGLPHRIGYFIGYMLVSRYMKETLKGKSINQFIENFENICIDLERGMA